MKLLCPLNIIRLREKNTTVNNILNTQGKSHDGLKLCRKLILTVLFLIFYRHFYSKLYYYRIPFNINILYVIIIYQNSSGIN